MWQSIAGWIDVMALDPNGVPLNCCDRYRCFPRRVRDALMIAFSTCDDPGCPIRSVHCQIDHLLAWIDDGLTDAVNGRPRCVGHNLWKEWYRRVQRRRRAGP